MKKEICGRCGKKVEMWKCGNVWTSSLHSDDLCLECYEKAYNKMNGKERKPNFAKIINI